jgi:hypothetical protein
MLIQIPVELRPNKLVDGSLDWSVPWQHPQDAAAECKAQGLDAESGYGKAYAVYVNGLLALPGSKDHRQIVFDVLRDVARRLKFLK